MGQSASVHIGMTMPVLDPSDPDGSVVDVVSPAVVVPSVAVPSVVVPLGLPVVALSVDGSLGFAVVVPESVPCELLPAPLVVGVPSVVGWPVVVIDPVIVSTAVGLVTVVVFVVVPSVPSPLHANSNGETSAATRPI